MTASLRPTLPPEEVTPAGVPRIVGRVLSLRGLEIAARLALASPFLVSGVVKLSDFAGATAEMAGLGLPAPALMAALVIATQLLGSGLFLSARWCWLGAGWLAGFTVFATLVAHPFWAFEGPDRARQTAVFFEHLAIVGGLMAAAILNQRRGAA